MSTNNVAIVMLCTVLDGKKPKYIEGKQYTVSKSIADGLIKRNVAEKK